jgi:hypothetical protein
VEPWLQSIFILVGFRLMTRAQGRKGVIAIRNDSCDFAHGSRSSGHASVIARSWWLFEPTSQRTIMPLAPPGNDSAETMYTTKRCRPANGRIAGKGVRSTRRDRCRSGEDSCSRR